MALFVRRSVPPTAIPAEPVWPVRSLLRQPGGRQLIQADLDERVERAETEANSPGSETDPSVAAASDAKKDSSPQFSATVVSTAIFIVGLIVAVGLFGTPTGPTFKPVEGIGAFALFYVAAQASERLVELILPAFEKVPGFGKAGKEVALHQMIACALEGGPGEPAANAQADVDQLRANRAVVVFGLTAALGMVLCGYLEADFLRPLGVTFAAIPGTAQQLLMMAVTGLIIGGGSKALHDLITNVSKSSEKKSTPAATGGEA